MIPGHEFFGRVEELGPGRGRALRRRPGRPRHRRADRSLRQVPLLHDRASTGCARCTTSSASSATSPTAAWRDFMRIPPTARVHKIPDGLSLEDAAIIEPLACAIHAVNRGDIQLDDVVVIAGAGPIGLMMVQVAHLKTPQQADRHRPGARAAGAREALRRRRRRSTRSRTTRGDRARASPAATAATSTSRRPARRAASRRAWTLIRKLGRFVEFSRVRQATRRSTGRSSATARSSTCAARTSARTATRSRSTCSTRGLVTSRRHRHARLSARAMGRGDRARQLARFDQGPAEAGALSIDRDRGLRHRRRHRHAEHQGAARATRAAGSSRSSAKGYQPDTPQPLWAEQWPDVWLDAVARMHRRVRAAAAAVEPASSRGRARDLHQQPLWRLRASRSTTTCEPLHPCLIWMDRRAPGGSRHGCARTSTSSGSTTITGNGVDSYYGFTKMLWLREQAARRLAQDAVLPAAQCLCHPRADRRDRGRSLARPATSAASTTRRRDWSDEMLDALGIPRTLMPERLVASSDVVGRLLPACGRSGSGCRPGTPVVAGGVDAAVATLAAGVSRAGPARRDDRHQHVLGIHQPDGRRAPRPDQHAARVRRRARRLRVRRRDHRRRVGHLVPRQLLPARSRPRAHGASIRTSCSKRGARRSRRAPRACCSCPT